MVSQVAQARTSTTGLCSQMAFEAVKLGPMAQMYMARRAAPYMLSGIVPAGAAQVIAATDYSQEATASIARMTAIMVSRSSSGHRVVLRRHDTRTWSVPTMHVWQNAQWHHPALMVYNVTGQAPLRQPGGQHHLAVRAAGPARLSSQGKHIFAQQSGAAAAGSLPICPRGHYAGHT